mgnify:CR=1 FL=1
MAAAAAMVAAAAGVSVERGAGQNPPASRTPLLLLAHSNFRANFVAISNGGDNNSQQFHFLKADRVQRRGGGGTARVAASPKIVASSSSDF